MKKVYVFYHRNTYPECGEPEYVADGVFTSKKILNAEIKKWSKKYPAVYGKDCYMIKEIRVNNFCQMSP
jgi:hypothetical protein